VLGALISDARLAFRWLVRSPAFSLVAGSSLAIGIGFNTALFSVVDALLLRPLPVRSPGSLVDVYTSGSDGDAYATTSYPDLLDFRARTSAFEDLAGHSAMFAALNLGDRSRLVLGEVVTGNYFQVLGVNAVVGRTLLPGDDRPGADRVAVISHRYWRRALGGDPSVLARSLRLRGQPYAIVGVAPPAFTGMIPLLAPDVWLAAAHVDDVEPAGIQDAVPSPTGTGRLDRRGQRWLFVKGRLNQGVTLDQACASLDLIMQQLVAEHPQTNRDRRISVKATSDVRVHPEADRVMVPLAVGLMAAVGLVLLVACANVASMLLARASARQREIGIRLAVGAGRRHLLQQLIVESLVLAFLGGVAGVLLAWWLTRLAGGLALPIPIPIAIDLRIDWRVLLFTLAVTIGAGILAGLAPALRALRTNVMEDLRADVSGATIGGRRWTLRDGLVVSQVAVTMLLLVCAALLARSLGAASRTDVGFRTAGLAVLSMDLDMVRYDAVRTRQFFERALERARAIPGVVSVSLAERVPFSINFNQQQIHVPGYQTPGEAPVTIQVTYVAPEYFRTLDIPILEGRGFTDADVPGSPNVVVVNDTMARRFWPGERAVGQRIHLRGPDGPAFEVVGVAADHRLRTVGEGPQPYVHFARAQRPGLYGVLLARTTGSASRLLGDLRAVLLELEPNLVFVESQTMEEQVAATLFPIRATAWIVSVVAGVALLLAAVGLYGVLAFTVARRTREIGIRMALGARTSDVLGLVLRRGLVLAGVGLVAGGAVAAAAAHVLGGLLYGIGVADLAAWGAAAGVVIAVATLANLMPARRAAGVDPTRALRAE
jgi:predicted permease